MVHQHPVDLFGHIPVKRPEASLDMSAFDMHLCRRQRSGQGGVGVTEYYYRIGQFFDKSLLHLFKHLTGLKAVAARAYAQVVIGAWYAHVLEEHSIHLIVIMLAGMNYDVIYSPLL